jgi:adenine/guanine phosphoribosyltransferase-like PRPP-binding protein
VCRVCRGPAAGGSGVCFACRVVARRLGRPLVAVRPLRLCPLPSPLYTVLLGYKESPVAEARLRFGAMVRALVHAVLVDLNAPLEALLGGPVDLVTVVPSTHRPGPAPLALVSGLASEVAGALPAARWAPDLLRRASAVGGSPPIAHMRPHPAAFRLPGADGIVGAGARVLLLDDTYVSGARAQSAAAALPRAGTAATVIVPLGRVLRPERVALHADFLERFSRPSLAWPWRRRAQLGGSTE